MTARALLAIAFAVSAAFPLLASEVRDDVPAATILCYHIVESPQDPRMEISRETFRQHMRYLASTGYNVIPLRHLYEYVAGKRSSIPKNAVVITIDDGWRSTYTEVLPEMQRRHFPFTVFIYPKIIGMTSLAMTWKQIRELADAGVDIQSHSLSHPFLTHRRHIEIGEKDYTEWLQRELADSKRILEKETGHEVSFIAYPYGDYDTRVAKMASEAGYTGGLTCDYGRVRKGSDPLRMKRVAIDKKVDFATFRRLLGAGSMPVEEVSPLPNQAIDISQPIRVAAKLPKFKTLDPKSVGMALMGSGVSTPYSYDPRDGSISVVLRDAITTLKNPYQRALVWATETRTGKRVEASWVFKLPTPVLPDPALCPTPVPDQLPADGPIPTMVPAANSVTAFGAPNARRTALNH